MWRSHNKNATLRVKTYLGVLLALLLDDELSGATVVLVAAAAALVAL
jgi:hypothetical protein